MKIRPYILFGKDDETCFLWPVVSFNPFYRSSDTTKTFWMTLWFLYWRVELHVSLLTAENLRP
jgi:hypothetical protein